MVSVLIMGGVVTKGKSTWISPQSHDSSSGGIETGIAQGRTADQKTTAAGPRKQQQRKEEKQQDSEEYSPICNNNIVLLIFLF